jgi:hypothetical protein
MGISIMPVTDEAAQLPIGRWSALMLANDERPTITIWALNAVKLHMLRSGAIYEMAKPEGGSPYRLFPELSEREVQAIWSGVPPDGVAPDRAQEFYDAEHAYAAAHEDRPGMPSFKLSNGPPWHITVQECRSVLEIGICREPLSHEAEMLEQAELIFDDVIVPVFRLGIEQAGVMSF